MESDQRGVIYDDHNVVLDVAAEVMLEALVAGDKLSAVGFALTGETEAKAGFRSIPGSTVIRSAAGEFSKDDQGRRTVGTWRSTLTATGLTSYDMLFLLNGNNKPFAAAGGFGTVALALNETVSVRWTIFLRK
jgi:hypothetical protein